MSSHISFIFSILAFAACLGVLANSVLSKQQNFKIDDFSTPIPVHTSCPLSISQTQKPLKLSRIQGLPTLTFSPDSRFLAVSDDSGGSGILIWDLLTQTSQNILPSTWGGQLRFSPNGQRFAIGFRSGDVILANLGNYTFIRLIGHERSINAISFSPDGRYLATSSADNTARIWDLKGKVLTVLPGLPKTKFGDVRDRYPSVSQVSWSAIGHLLTITSGKEVQIWQLPSQKLMTLKATKGEATDATFSPNGKMVAIASDGIGKVWDLSSRQLVTLAQDNTKVVLISFSPDGQKLLTASTNNMLKLWNLKGKILAVFKGHTETIVQTAFSPDGQCIFTSSTDGTVRIWNIAGQETTRLSGSSAISLSPDGQYLATSEDNTILIWRLR